jgi:hypothetical protein
MQAVPQTNVHTDRLEQPAARVQCETEISVRPHDDAGVVLGDTAEEIRVEEIDSARERQVPRIRI